MSGSCDGESAKAQAIRNEVGDAFAEWMRANAIDGAVAVNMYVDDGDLRIVVGLDLVKAEALANALRSLAIPSGCRQQDDVEG